MRSNLITERLSIGPLHEGDRADGRALLTNDTVGLTYMLPSLASQEAADALFDRLVMLSTDEERCVFGVHLGEHLIGIINDTDIQGTTVELGYAYHPSYYGKGYATEALRAVITYLFSLGYTEIRASAFEDNLASLRVMEKCGMTRTQATEYIEYRGQGHTCICFVIRRKERDT